MKATFKLHVKGEFYVCGRNTKGQFVDLMKTANNTYLANIWGAELKEKEFPGSTPFVEVIQFLNS